MNRAIKIFGLDHQLFMLAEECSELIKEIMKRNRYNLPVDNADLVSEIVDVQVVLNQIISVLDRDQFDTIMYNKLKYLARLIAKENK